MDLSPVDCGAACNVAPELLSGFMSDLLAVNISVHISNALSSSDVPFKSLKHPSQGMRSMKVVRYVVKAVFSHFRGQY